MSAPRTSNVTSVRPVRVGDMVRSRSWNKMEWPAGMKVTVVTPSGFGRTSSTNVDVQRCDFKHWVHADGVAIDETFDYVFDNGSRPSEAMQLVQAASGAQYLDEPRDAKCPKLPTEKQMKEALDALASKPAPLCSWCDRREATTTDAEGQRVCAECYEGAPRTNDAKPIDCTHCTLDGECAYPWYGVAPHRCFYKIPDAKIGQSELLPREQWPSHFEEDPECPGLGTYTHCPECGAGKDNACVRNEDHGDASPASTTGNTAASEALSGCAADSVPRSASSADHRPITHPIWSECECETAAEHDVQDAASAAYPTPPNYDGSGPDWAAIARGAFFRGATWMREQRSQEASANGQKGTRNDDEDVRRGELARSVHDVSEGETNGSNHRSSVGEGARGVDGDQAGAGGDHAQVGEWGGVDGAVRATQRASEGPGSRVSEGDDRGNRSGRVPDQSSLNNDAGRALKALNQLGESPAKSRIIGAMAALMSEVRHEECDALRMDNPTAEPSGYVVEMVPHDDGWRSQQELRVTRGGEVILSERDGGEPEDASFYRDWRWVPEALKAAYAFGLEDAHAADYPRTKATPEVAEVMHMISANIERLAVEKRHPDYDHDACVNMSNALVRLAEEIEARWPDAPDSAKADGK